MQIPKIDVQPSTLPQLLIQIEQGKLQVPRFQRDFVWPLAKTRKLLDSMFKEFPIGSFFLWKAPADLPYMFRTLEDLGIPKPKPGHEISYILDGQQRLTSLFVTINGIKIGWRDYGRICLDLDTATRYLQIKEEGFDEDIFVYQKPDNFRYVAVSDLTGDDHLTIFKNIPEDLQSAFNKAYNLFQTYPFSVVWIQEQTLSDAIIIFQRINQEGKALSRYDLVCANLWQKDFDFRKKVADQNKIFKNKGFGKLHDTIFTQTFSLVINDQCTTLAELSLKTKDVKKTWSKVIASLNLAVQFAIDNLGVKRASYLPYRGILVVLANYFYKSPNTSLSVDQRNALWDWFWKVTLSERYSSTSPSRMADDAQLLSKSFTGEQVSFDYPIKINAELIARTKMTSTTSSLRNAFLCLSALKNPINLKDNSPINLSDDYFSDLKKAERHHIFPVGYLREQGLEVRLHLIPNFCFIPADLNREIGKQDPAKYMAKYKKINPHFDISASSHFIPVGEDSSIWTNDYNDFLLQRAEIIARELSDLVNSVPEDIHVEFMSKDLILKVRVDVLEVRIRDFIDDRLNALEGNNYWKLSIPSDTRGLVRKRIKDRLSRHPYESQSFYSTARKRLDFCDVSDYSKIFLRNWPIFEGVFKNKFELNKHLDSYRTIRNALHHNREYTDIELQLSEAAMTWLERSLDVLASRLEQAEETS